MAIVKLVLRMALFARSIKPPLFFQPAVFPDYLFLHSTAIYISLPNSDCGNKVEIGQDV